MESFIRVALASERWLPSGGHSDLCDESGAEPYRRFTARRQSIPFSPLDMIEDEEDCRMNSSAQAD